MNEKEIVVSIEGKNPTYVIQHNAISRSIYKMSANARKTIALAMAYRKIKQTLIEEEEQEKYEAQDILEIEFPVKDFFETFDIEKTKTGVLQLAKTLDEITGFKVGIYHDNGKVEFLTWVQYAKIDLKNDEIQIKFSEDILNYLNENELGYCKLLMADIAELKSFYAFRWLEIARSYESLAGQNGNKKDEWYFERDIETIREEFGLENNQYRIFQDFKKRVIEEPIAEINSSKIGIELKPEYKKDEYDKRKVKRTKFHCKRKARRLKDNEISLTNGEITVKTEVPPVKVIKDYPTETDKSLKKFENNPVLTETVKRLLQKSTERESKEEI